MLLAVDVGNTQTVIGLYESKMLQEHWRITTVARDTADELAVRIHALLALAGLHFASITDVVIASVVPPLTRQWELLCTRFSVKSPLVVDGSLDLGLKVGIDKPSDIGADRLADAVAAIELYGSPVIVVDFGTATNIEVIDREECLVGGIIAPGLTTSAEALFNAAARLAKMTIKVPPSVIGTSTQTAVQSGLTFGEIDRVDGLIRRIFDELGYEATVIATGGLSSRVVGLSRTIALANDDLTLEGLRIIYQRIRG